jgi:hypothetical protein
LGYNFVLFFARGKGGRGVMKIILTTSQDYHTLGNCKKLNVRELVSKII